jgi:hypothetical protein
MDSGDYCRKGTADIAQHRPSLLDSLSTQSPGSKAELQGYSMVTGVASIADERTLLELGFRLLQRNSGKKKE